jgi:hypothetical protein
MHRTRIEPAITFRRAEGGTAVVRDVDSLAEWLDAVYDAVLDPRRSEGALTLMQRSLQLHEIERVLLRLAEEAGDDAERISPALRDACQAVIAEYREIVSAPRSDGPSTPTRPARSLH